jgi:DNA polymerase-3 subunit beta
MNQKGIEMTICNTKQLLQACAFAGSVCKTRTPLPALTHIRLTAAKGEITAFGSNLEIFKTQRCVADVKGGFDVGLPASLLVGFLRSLPAEHVELTVEKAVVTLKAGPVQASIQCLAAEEFPNVPKVAGEPLLISAVELQKKLKQVIHAAHTDTEAWRARCAVWFQFFNSALNLTSFDGKALATTKIDALGVGDYIVPTELVREVISVDEPNDVSLTLSESYAVFAGETWEVRGKLIDAQVVDWQQAEKGYQFKDFTTVNRDALVDSLRRILVFTPDNPNLNNATTFEFKDGRLNLSLNRQNSVQETLECSGGTLSISINPQSILDAISVIESDTFKIGLIDELSPLQITDGDYRVLTMPYRQS